MPANPSAASVERFRYGIRGNIPHLTALVVINLLVGAMVGQERTVVPLLATDVFGLTLGLATTTFLVSFGVAKACGNLAAGRLADGIGRRPVLIFGWLLMVPVPFILAFADTWMWVVGANALLGTGQGLAWSMTITMKMDIVGGELRGLAAGANEAAGYLGVAAAAFVTGVLAQHAGLRPAPFVFGTIVSLCGVGLSAGFGRETKRHVEREVMAVPAARHAFRRDRTFTAAAQAGLVTNLNDAVAWVLFPIVLTEAGLSLASVGFLVAVYPAVWGLGQLATGPLSDRWGRKRFVVSGMLLQAGGLAVIGAGSAVAAWAAGGVILGVGTAMVYPVLLASVGDVAEPRERASRLGIYRFWRDAGFAVGGILAGVVAGTTGVRAAIWITGACTALSGVAASIWLRETRRRPGP